LDKNDKIKKDKAVKTLIAPERYNEIIAARVKIVGNEK
jgi:hypothetical protein